MADSDNGNGRKPFTMNLKTDIMDGFKTYCEKNGFMPSRRIEVLVKKDMDDNKG